MSQRFPELRLDQMTAAQRAVADTILGGPRKSLIGPFNAWLRSPALAAHLQAVGEYIRFGSSLDKRLNELAILMTAYHWRAEFEWYAHAPMALDAGLDPGIVEAIGAGRKPEQMREDEAVVWDFTEQLRRDRTVDDVTYRKAVDMLGEQGVMDLIAVNGYYDLVSMTLNVAKVSPPADAAVPFR